MKSLARIVTAVLALAPLLAGAPSPVEAIGAPGGVRAVVDGPEFYCNNCYDESFCDDGLLITWQDWGPEDAFVLAIASTPDCYATDKTCDELIKCNSDSEWNPEDSKLAAALEAALDRSDYATAAALVGSHPKIGTFVPERGVVIIRASECVGGVRAVLSVDETFPDAL